MSFLRHPQVKFSTPAGLVKAGAKNRRAGTANGSSLITILPFRQRTSPALHQQHLKSIWKEASLQQEVISLALLLVSNFLILSWRSMPENVCHLDNGHDPNNFHIFPLTLSPLDLFPSNSDQHYHLHIFALAHIGPPQGDMWDFQKN